MDERSGDVPGLKTPGSKRVPVEYRLRVRKACDGDTQNGETRGESPSAVPEELRIRSGLFRPKMVYRIAPVLIGLSRKKPKRTQGPRATPAGFQ